MSCLKTYSFHSDTDLRGQNIIRYLLLIQYQHPDHKQSHAMSLSHDPSRHGWHKYQFPAPIAKLYSHVHSPNNCAHLPFITRHARDYNKTHLMQSHCEATSLLWSVLWSLNWSFFFFFDCFALLLTFAKNFPFSRFESCVWLLLAVRLTIACPWLWLLFWISLLIFCTKQC